MTVGGGALLVLAYTLSAYSEDKLLRILTSKRIVLVLAVSAWAILYFIYVLDHDIPVNPAGFYLESSRQLIRNGFHLPKYLDGFGENGIPFVYPPLAFYVIAVAGYLLDGEYIAALYVPGILLPIQAIAAYSFMRRWRESEQAALWAAVIILLVPHIFFRTLHGDGITTGLAGVFLFLSWRFAVLSNGSGSYRTLIMGGFFVGLSLLSHPAIGLFCAVTFTILYFSRVGVNIQAIPRLIASGIMALAVILPWLLTVISLHGFDPLLAGLQDSKSSTFIIRDMESTLSYISWSYARDAQSRLALLLLPFAVAIPYSIVRGPRVIFPLLVASILTFSGHPSVSMLVFAASLGIFYGGVLFPALGRLHLRIGRQKNAHDVPVESWFVYVFAGATITALFLLCLSYAVRPTFSPGEKATFDWIRANTQIDSTFLMEGRAENLVYFGRREILLPVLGAEWIPDAEYGNGLERNLLAKSEIFECRKLECLSSAFRRYEVSPDFMIYRVSDGRESTWIDELSASPMFDVTIESESIITLSRYGGGADHIPEAL